VVISIKSTFAVIAVACVLGLTSRPVLAGLGGDVASIESDAAVMKGAMSSLPAAAMNHPSA
jgi:hypothetical protein